MGFSEIIYNLGYILLITNFIVYLKSNYYNSLIKAFKVLTVYLGYILIIQLITYIYNRNGQNNLFLSHYYFIGRFFLLSYFYYLILKTSIYLKIIQLIFALVLFVLGVQFFINPSLYWKFNLLEIIISTIPIVLYALFYFYESFGIKKKKFLLFNSGVFFYLLSSALIFTTGNYVVSSKSDFIVFIYDLNAFLYLIYLIFIFIEWYQNFRKPRANYTEDEIED